jgi:hypothetical protein
LLEKCLVIAYMDRTFVSEDELSGFSTPDDGRTHTRSIMTCSSSGWAGRAVWLDDGPGAMEISRWNRMTVDIGKCSVCGVAKTVWLNCKAGMKLYEHCYGRGLRKEAKEIGVI